MIEIFNGEDVISAELENKIKHVAKLIAEDYELKIDYLNIIILSDDELLDINRQFLNHDYYTDIITFNYSDFNKTLQSELYLSRDRIFDNAENLGIDFTTELARVMIHGILHLAGFNDSTPEEKVTMRSFEDHYLKTIGFHVEPVKKTL